MLSSSQFNIHVSLLDSDHDGLPDEIERKIGTDPFDADTDDDGLVDGNAGSEDLNADGIVDPGETDPLNPDTDGDGIFDGTERGLTVPETPDTNLAANHFVPDADPSTVTDPSNPDTDGDGISDGQEDINKDGAFNPELGETNPNQSNVIPGDLNHDGCVDQADVNIINAARNKPATGPDDPRDLDRDGKITPLDARRLVLMCTNPRCAICGH